MHFLIVVLKRIYKTHAVYSIESRDVKTAKERGSVLLLVKGDRTDR